MYENLFPENVTGCSSGVCWNNPDPFSYVWTTPPHSMWDMGSNVADGVNFLASILMELLASGLHIAILFTSYLSDPSWFLTPVADKLSTLFRAGFDNVFVRFVPILLLLTVLYVIWQYIKGHHAKIVTGMASTALSGVLIAFFFFNFGTAFKWLNEAGNAVTTEVGTAIAATAGLNVQLEYDALWNAYVLYPWEFGQFGQVSNRLQDFDVSPNVTAEGATYTDDSGAERSFQPSDNWVNLMLRNTSPEARESLAEVLFGEDQPVLMGQLSDRSPASINPMQNIAIVLLECLFIIPPVVFLIYLGFQLFVREVMFMITALLGIVTVPMSFVPEIGWRVTTRWMREGLGHLVERLANVIYGTAVFAFAGIFTEVLTVKWGGGGLIISMLLNAAIFAAAILYRNFVFGKWVHPAVDRVRYGDEMPSRKIVHSSQEDAAPSTKRGTTAGVLGMRKTGRLAERFSHAGDMRRGGFSATGAVRTLTSSEARTPRETRQGSSAYPSLRQPQSEANKRPLAREENLVAQIRDGETQRPVKNEELRDHHIESTGPEHSSRPETEAVRSSQMEASATQDLASRNERGEVRRTHQTQERDSITGRFVSAARTNAKGKRYPFGQLRSKVSQVFLSHVRSVSAPGVPTRWADRAQKREEVARKIDLHLHERTVGVLLGDQDWKKGKPTKTSQRTSHQTRHGNPPSNHKESRTITPKKREQPSQMRMKDRLVSATSRQINKSKEQRASSSLRSAPKRTRPKEIKRLSRQSKIPAKIKLRKSSLHRQAPANKRKK